MLNIKAKSKRQKWKEKNTKRCGKNCERIGIKRRKAGQRW